MQNWKQKTQSFSKPFSFSFLDSIEPEELRRRDEEIRRAEEREIKEQRDNAFFGCGINEDCQNNTYKNYQAITDEQKKALSAVWDFTKKVCAGEYCALVLFGNPGAGKTHLVTACLNAALHSVKKNWETGWTEYYSGRYVLSRTISSRLMETVSFKCKETYDEVINDYSNSDLLVIDEVGRDPLSTAGESSGLFAITDKRKSKGKAIAFCTNGNFDEFSRILGSAAMSRILQNAIVVDMTKIPDWRLSHRA